MWWKIKLQQDGQQWNRQNAFILHQVQEVLAVTITETVQVSVSMREPVLASVRCLKTPSIFCNTEKKVASDAKKFLSYFGNLAACSEHH